MKFNNKTYDALKWVAMCVLPGATTLWLALAKIWGLPYGAEIGGTLSAVDAFLGVLLGISTTQYNKTKDVTDNV